MRSKEENRVEKEIRKGKRRRIINLIIDIIALVALVFAVFILFSK